MFDILGHWLWILILLISYWLLCYWLYIRLVGYIFITYIPGYILRVS